VTRGRAHVILPWKRKHNAHRLRRYCRCRPRRLLACLGDRVSRNRRRSNSDGGTWGPRCLRGLIVLLPTVVLVLLGTDGTCGPHRWRLAYGKLLARIWRAQHRRAERRRRASLAR
jgi:hypothetical protein